MNNLSYEAKYGYRKTNTVNEYDKVRFSSLKGKFYARLQRNAIKVLMKAVPKGSTILDMPCGTGRLDSLLMNEGYKILVADVSYEMLKHTKLRIQKKHCPSFWGALALDGCAMPFCSNSFSCVLTIKLMHLIPDSTKLSIAEEINRVTSRFLIVSFSYDSFFAKFKRFSKRFISPKTIQEKSLSLADISELLGNAGLIIKKKRYIFRLYSEEIIVLAEKRPNRKNRYDVIPEPAV